MNTIKALDKVGAHHDRQATIKRDRALTLNAQAAEHAGEAKVADQVATNLSELVKPLL